MPAVGASITVFLAGTGTPATIYSDDGLTTTTNPLTADINGRFAFYVADGRYDLQYSGAGLTTYKLTDIDVHDVTDLTSAGKTPIPGNLQFTGINTHAGTETFSAQLVSSVATGTAPFSVSSTTLVPNLNVATAVTATNLTGPGAVTGTFSGSPTFSGNPTFTGAVTVNSLQGLPVVGGATYPCTAAGINAAIAAAPAAGGVINARGCSAITGQTTTVNVGSNTQNITLQLGTYTYSGTANPLFLVHCRSVLALDQGTVIQQTSNTANGVILAGGNSPTGALSGGIEGSGLILGPGAAVSTGNGLVLGGTTDPGNIIGNAANYVHIGPITITGFGMGEKYGNNTYIIQHQHTSLNGNANCAIFPSTVTPVGEGIEYSHGLCASSTATPANFTITGSGNFAFHSTSFDQANLIVNGVANAADVVMDGQFHFEYPVASSALDFIQMSGNVSHLVELYGPEMIEDTVSARTEFISQASGHLKIFGGKFLAAQATANIVNTSSTGGTEVYGVLTNNISASIGGTGATNLRLEVGTFVPGFGSAAVVSPRLGPSTSQLHIVPAVATDTFALLAAAQTLTNKTLTSPAIATPTLSGSATQGGVTAPITQTIASGTATMTTAAITGPNCGTTVTVSATGVLTTDSITFADNAAPATTTNGPLTIKAWPTANNVNFVYCVQSGTITPAAATLNFRVVR